MSSPDIVLVVLDATSLERNLPLGLQIMELTENVIFCLNLTDEAEKRGISVDDVRLERLTGVPVIKMAARQGVGLRELKEMLLAVAEGRKSIRPIGIDWDAFAPETESDYHSAEFQEKRSLAFLSRAKEICDAVVQKKEERDSRHRALRSNPAFRKNGDTLHAAFVGWRVLDYGCRGKCTVRISHAAVPSMRCCDAKRLADIASTPLAARTATGWRLADGELGGGGYAAADGDFFPVVYIVRGFRFAATDCL